VEVELVMGGEDHPQLLNLLAAEVVVGEDLVPEVMLELLDLQMQEELDQQQLQVHRLEL
jgi:hypothetical protein